MEADMVTLATLKSWSGTGGYCDETALLLAPIAVPAGLVVSAHLSFRACDQGWGNMKGRVFATASIPSKGATGERDESDRWASDVVPHYRAFVEQTFLADSGFVTKLNHPASIWTEERTIELERHVGAGGGHELHINDLQLTVQIKPLAELARAFAAEHPLQVGFLSGHVVTIPAGWVMPEAGPKKRGSGGGCDATLLELMCANWDPEKVGRPDPEEIELVDVEGRPLDPRMTGKGFVLWLLKHRAAAAVDGGGCDVGTSTRSGPVLPGQLAKLAATFRPTVTVVAELASSPAAGKAPLRQEITIVVGSQASVGYLRRKLAAAFRLPSSDRRSDRRLAFQHHAAPAVTDADATGTVAGAARPRKHRYRAADDGALLSDIGIGGGSVLVVTLHDGGFAGGLIERLSGFSCFRARTMSVEDSGVLGAGPSSDTEA